MTLNLDVTQSYTASERRDKAQTQALKLLTGTAILLQLEALLIVCLSHLAEG